MVKYIITERIKLPRELQEKFIISIKSNSRLTWKELATFLAVSEETLRIDWKLGRTTIPARCMPKMESLSDKNILDEIKNSYKILPPSWGQTKGAIESLKL